VSKRTLIHRQSLKERQGSGCLRFQRFGRYPWGKHGDSGHYECRCCLHDVTAETEPKVPSMVAPIGWSRMSAELWVAV
jgi:hypothetical protein